MVSSREGFLFSDIAAFGRGSVGAECSIRVCLNTLGDSCRGQWGDGEYRVECGVKDI